MCGVIGVVYANSNENKSGETSVAQALIDGMTVLQHRGQDAAGIMTLSSDCKMNSVKGIGLVKEVFDQDNVVQLLGNIGIGHVRYPTSGNKGCMEEAQPLYTNAPFGLALAHNGNLTNPNNLREAMRREFRHINTNSDSELLLNVFAEELQRKRMNPIHNNNCKDEVFDTVRSTMRRCHGGYASLILINGIGLLAFRDPFGIRPLCIGRNGNNYTIASESVAIDALGYRLVGDINPGEAVLVTYEGELHRQQCHNNPSLLPCLFEYVYFARPDSVLDGISVYESRLRMGDILAEKIKMLAYHQDIDVVVPIPDTSRTSALQCAVHLNKPYREGFVKNRYIARTFIMPGAKMRRKSVRMKLNAINDEFENKVVLLIDDSIVRGTTSKEIIQMAREAGATKVIFASAAPPVRYPNVYGIDIPSMTELIAHDHSEDEIAEIIGADKVIYNDLQELEKAVINCVKTRDRDDADLPTSDSSNVTAGGNNSPRGEKQWQRIPISGFDSSCFNGVYATGDFIIGNDGDSSGNGGSKGKGSGSSDMSVMNGKENGSGLKKQKTTHAL